MKKILFMFAAALMMVACSNEEIVTNDDVQYVSELKLNFGKGDSRIAATHDPASGLKFAWEDGEEIVVYENANADALPLYYVYDKASNSFKAKYDSYKMTVGKEYFAVNHTRQTSIPLSLDDNGKTIVKMNIERKEPYGLSTIPMITDVFTAEDDATIATMHHLVGVVEIPVKLAEGATITTMTQFSLYASGAKLGRDFTATPENPYIKSTDDAYDTSTIAGCELSTTYKSIFIPVLPGTYSNANLNYNYNESSGYVSLGNITVERGKITKVAETTVNPT